jgi:hypothetical protein
MARSRDYDGIYVDRPRPDVYLDLIIMTFAATLIAVVILWLEYSRLT